MISPEQSVTTLSRRITAIYANVQDFALTAKAEDSAPIRQITAR
jgi:hypothetical protein